MAGDPKRTATVSEYAAALGFSRGAFVNALCLDADKRVAVHTVASYLEMNYRWLGELLDRKDRALSTDEAARLLFVCQGTVIRKYDPDARIPRIRRNGVMRFSERRIREMASKLKSVKLY